MTFRDREDAGQRLAEEIARRPPRREPPVVLALPRGGVPVAVPVARRLGAPLDILVVRKLGTPGHDELALGAISRDGIRVLNEDVITAYSVGPEVVERVARSEGAELERREELYRAGRPAPSLQGREAILVDDGLATGATMRAAVQVARALGAARVAVAVPIGAPEVCRLLSREADEVICLQRPANLVAVGRWYDEFDQVSDDEVRRALAGIEEERPS